MRFEKRITIRSHGIHPPGVTLSKFPNKTLHSVIHPPSFLLLLEILEVDHHRVGQKDHLVRSGGASRKVDAELVRASHNFTAATKYFRDLAIRGLPVCVCQVELHRTATREEDADLADAALGAENLIAVRVVNLLVHRTTSPWVFNMPKLVTLVVERHQICPHAAEVRVEAERLVDRHDNVAWETAAHD